jgi:hypothetical protein
VVRERRLVRRLRKVPAAGALVALRQMLRLH